MEHIEVNFRHPRHNQRDKKYLGEYHIDVVSEYIGNPKRVILRRMMKVADHLDGVAERLNKLANDIFMDE